MSDLKMILASVTQLANKAHEFITNGFDRQFANDEINSVWWPLTSKLGRRLEQLEFFVDDVLPDLPDIIGACFNGVGRNVRITPAEWQKYETDRHKRIVEWLASVMQSGSKRTRGPDKNTLSGVKRMVAARKENPRIRWKRLCKVGGFDTVPAAKMAWKRYHADA